MHLSKMCHLCWKIDQAGYIGFPISQKKKKKPNKLGRRCWELASCQVSVNSIQQFCDTKMSQPIRWRVAILVFRSARNLVEDVKQNRSTDGCSTLKRSVDMTSSGKNGLNIRTNASPKWDRTRCPEELPSSVGKPLPLQCSMETYKIW